MMILLAMHIFILASGAGGLSSSTTLVGAIIIAVLGSGGIGYFIDRRSVQASRLASDAVDATTVFTKSLEEERHRRTELEQELAYAKAELTMIATQAHSNASIIEELHRKIQLLERDLMRSMRDMNEIVRRMFTSTGQTTEYMVERWRAVMTATHLAVIQADYDGHMVFASEETLALLQYDASDLIGQSLTKLVPPEYREEYLSVLLHVTAVSLDEDLVPPVRIGMLRKDGTVLMVMAAFAAHGRTVTIILRELVTDDLPEPKSEVPLPSEQAPS